MTLARTVSYRPDSTASMICWVDPIITISRNWFIQRPAVDSSNTALYFSGTTNIGWSKQIQIFALMQCQLFRTNLVRLLQALFLCILPDIKDQAGECNEVAPLRTMSDDGRWHHLQHPKLSHFWAQTWQGSSEKDKRHVQYIEDSGNETYLCALVKITSQVHTVDNKKTRSPCFLTLRFSRISPEPPKLQKI